MIPVSSYLPRRITSVLILGVLMLTLASEMTHVVTFDPHNGETYRLGWAFPQRNAYMNWFSMSINSPVPMTYTVLLFALSALLMGRQAHELSSPLQKSLLWLACGLCLLYAVEKVTALHLWLPLSYRQILSANWMLWCGLIIPVMYGVFYMLPVRLRYWLTSGCLMLIGSLLMDWWSVYITGTYSGHHMIGALMGDAEGLMEMFAAVLIIHGGLVCRAEQEKIIGQALTER